MAGRPPTVRPTGCHWPSPGVGVATNGVMAAGTGRWAGPAGWVVEGVASGAGMAPFWGFPPLGGACQVYQVFSAQVTRPPPPWSRTHSVSRAPGVFPSAGSVAADPAEIHTGVRASTMTRATVDFGWRPIRVRRRRIFSLRRARRSRRVGRGIRWAWRDPSVSRLEGVETTSGMPVEVGRSAPSAVAPSVGPGEPGGSEGTPVEVGASERAGKERSADVAPRLGPGPTRSAGAPGRASDDAPS